MTREERKLTVEYLESMKEGYIEGEGYERHPLPEWYAIDKAIEELEHEPCEDAISRQAVLDLVNSDWKYEGLEEPIENLPPVKPVACIAKVNFSKEDMQEIVDKKVEEMGVRKKGKWILTDDDMIYCSECEDSYYPRPIDASWKYCPNCGAEMESKG